jgi:hypothetical protein
VPYASRHSGGSWYQVPTNQSLMTLRAMGPSFSSLRISARRRSSIAASSLPAWSRTRPNAFTSSPTVFSPTTSVTVVK